jgi:hypothetical protein
MPEQGEESQTGPQSSGPLSSTAPGETENADQNSSALRVPIEETNERPVEQKPEIEDSGLGVRAETGEGFSFEWLAQQPAGMAFAPESSKDIPDTIEQSDTLPEAKQTAINEPAQAAELAIQGSEETRTTRESEAKSLDSTGGKAEQVMEGEKPKETAKTEEQTASTSGVLEKTTDAKAQEEQEPRISTGFEPKASEAKALDPIEKSTESARPQSKSEAAEPAAEKTQPERAPTEKTSESVPPSDLIAGLYYHGAFRTISVVPESMVEGPLISIAPGPRSSTPPSVIEDTDKQETISIAPESLVDGPLISVTPGARTSAPPGPDWGPSLKKTISLIPDNLIEGPLISIIPGARQQPPGASWRPAQNPSRLPPLPSLEGLRAWVRAKSMAPPAPEEPEPNPLRVEVSTVTEPRDQAPEHIAAEQLPSADSVSDFWCWALEISAGHRGVFLQAFAQIAVECGFYVDLLGQTLLQLHRGLETLIVPVPGRRIGKMHMKWFEVQGQVNDGWSYVLVEPARLASDWPKNLPLEKVPPRLIHKGLLRAIS